MTVNIDVLGIFHSATYTVIRQGDKKSIVAQIAADGGFWIDADANRFIPYQAILGIEFSE